LDLQSACLDAVEILRIVRGNEQEYHLPVIFMAGVTGTDSDYDRAELEAFSHADFLAKPFSAEELAMLLTNQRLRQQKNE
jgi:CheY-like chemotaxis protein